jgi:hypothetical protein
MAMADMQDLADIFPKMEILQGNHDMLPKRKAQTIGLPSRYIRDDNEVFGLPDSWTWHFEVNLTMSDGKPLMLRHNLTKDAIKTALHHNKCFAQGHYHEDFRCQWVMDNGQNVWGVTTGCLVDDSSLAMAYNKPNMKRPQLGCVMVLDGVPNLIHMRLDEEGNWTGDLE